MAADNESRERVPRMRTVAKILAELKALDPETEVTEYYIRHIVKDGAVPVTWAGSKALINLDDVLALLRMGTRRVEPKPSAVSGIRRLDA